jgi:PAS domain-containing protein
MDESQQVAGLIGDIYDTAIDPTLWAATLQRTCEYIGGATGTLLSQDSATGSARYYFQWGNDAEYLKTYQETYVKLNPVLVSTLLYAKPGDVRSTIDLMPLDEFFASRFYKEWVAPQGLVDSVFVLIDKSGSSYAILAVTRHQRHGLVDDAARQRMRLLAPHFRRAVAIGRIIEPQRAKAKALSETLDGIAAATFLVDAQGHILHANTSGQSMLAERDALVTNGRRLHTNAVIQACASGSLSAYPISTPIRRIWSGCCARADIGHAAAPPRSVMNWRRFTGHPHRSSHQCCRRNVCDKQDNGQRAIRTLPIAVRNCRNSAPTGNLPRAVRRGYHNSRS